MLLLILPHVRERERGQGLRAGNLNLSLRLQIQSEEEISPGIILTERWVNPRGTFKTDLRSSPTPLTDRADGRLCQHMWLSDLYKKQNPSPKGSATAQCLSES